METPQSIINKVRDRRGSDFSHSGAVQNIAAGTWTKVLNDTLGPNTDETRKPMGSPSLYDKVNNRIILRPYSIGTPIAIRFDAVMTPVINAQLDVRLFWQKRDAQGNNTANFRLRKTLGQGLADVGFHILEDFNVTIDGPQQRQGYIEIEVFSKGSDSTLLVSGVKVTRLS